MRSGGTVSCNRLTDLAARLGHSFSDPALLTEALTHGSSSGRGERSYERLEFLGDRIVGLVIAEALYHRYPTEAEGALAKRLAALVQRDALAAVARQLELGDCLILSVGENSGGGRDNAAILSDVCEAVIGALYLDAGLEKARDLIVRLWAPLFDAAPRPPQDAKTALQEWAQGRGLPLPRYREVLRSGPAHNPRFVIEVTVEGFPSQSGEGKAKRNAEQAAASALLALVTGTP